MSPFENLASQVSTFSIFKDMQRSTIEALCHGGQVAESRHHEELFRYGDTANFFGIVLSGAYKLSRPTGSGDDVILYFSTPGDVVAALVMSQPKPTYPVSVIAMGPSRFLKLSKECYINYWQGDSSLLLKIQSLLSTRMNMFQDQKAMSRAPLSQRIAALLIGLLEKQPNQSNPILPLPLTRKEIADNVGSSVEAVIRIMSDWSKQGVLETNERQIHILKPQKLIEEFANH